MWVKLENGVYLETESGSEVNHYEVKNEDSSPSTFAIRIRHPLANRGVPQNVQSGYSTVEEALAALDDVMANVDFVQAQPPVVDEETSNVDSKEGE